MDDIATPWRQINITYSGQDHDRERNASAHLSRILPAGEAAGAITQWWFIRKGPWRIRYRLPDPAQDDLVHDLLTDGMTWTRDVYEPEVHAFGGLDGMATAHALFHADSRHLLGFLAGAAADRRERSLLLLTTFMRAAGLDWMEQGDVWARVAEQRAPLLTEPTDPTAWTEFTGGVRHLLLDTPRPNALSTAWQAAFRDAGGQLQRIREQGALTRGIRAVTAFHVIHHWNRIGIPGKAQALLARAAEEAVFVSS